MDMEAAVHPMRVDSRSWPAAGREAFLDHLAATCNVREAAAAGGVCPKTAHKWRRQDAEFARAWSEALALGYQMLETLLVGHALAAREGRAIEGDEVMPPVALNLALTLLSRHRDAPGRPRHKVGAPRAYADRDDTDRAILAKLAQIEKRRAKPSAAGGGK